MNDNGRDARSSGVPKGVPPSLGKSQRSLEYVLFHCLSFLSIFVEGNGGFTIVCNGAIGKGG